MDDTTLLQSPQLWPEFPYLRVDRRTTPRQGQGICFVRSSEEGEVEPVVYVTAAWPPREETEPMVVFSFGLQDFAALVEQGWKVVEGI